MESCALHISMCIHVYCTCISIHEYLLGSLLPSTPGERQSTHLPTYLSENTCFIQVSTHTHTKRNKE